MIRAKQIPQIKKFKLASLVFLPERGQAFKIVAISQFLLVSGYITPEPFVKYNIGTIQYVRVAN